MDKTFSCIYCHQEHPFDFVKCPGSDKALTPVHKLSSTTLQGKYAIKTFIGEGGMGVIYEAEHTSIGKKVAVKFLNPDVSQSRNAYERFKREAKAAALIDHKNIVGISDIGKTPEGIPFIIMEYLAGEDLGRRILNLKIIPAGEAAAILSQVLEALGAVHSCGIIHRDLKPENIFLARESGGGEIVKILDFGVSKLTQSDNLAVKISSSGLVFGTPFYISPEQAEGQRKADHRADLYAAGVIFYEMITGQLPYFAKTYGRLLLEIIRSPIPDPREIIPAFPESLTEFVRTSLAKNPDQRFQSAQEMLRELKALDLSSLSAVPTPVAKVKLETRTSMLGRERPTPVEEILDLKHSEKPLPQPDKVTCTEPTPRTRREKITAGEYKMIAGRQGKGGKKSGSPPRPSSPAPAASPAEAPAGTLPESESDLMKEMLEDLQGTPNPDMGNKDKS